MPSKRRGTDLCGLPATASTCTTISPYITHLLLARLAKVGLETAQLDLCHEALYEGMHPHSEGPRKPTVHRATDPMPSSYNVVQCLPPNIVHGSLRKQAICRRVCIIYDHHLSSHPSQQTPRTQPHRQNLQNAIPDNPLPYKEAITNFQDTIAQRLILTATSYGS